MKEHHIVTQEEGHSHMGDIPNNVRWNNLEESVVSAARLSIGQSRCKFRYNSKK